MTVEPSLSTLTLFGDAGSVNCLSLKELSESSRYAMKASVPDIVDACDANPSESHPSTSSARISPFSAPVGASQDHQNATTVPSPKIIGQHDVSDASEVARLPVHTGVGEGVGVGGVGVGAGDGLGEALFQFGSRFSVSWYRRTELLELAVIAVRTTVERADTSDGSVSVRVSVAEAPGFLSSIAPLSEDDPSEHVSDEVQSVRVPAVVCTTLPLPEKRF